MTYIGPGGLEFAERLAAMGGTFAVPTTTNACGVDRRDWRALGIPKAHGLPSERLADAYVRLGAAPSFTCAPYLRDDAPVRGEHLGYSESNAVVYVNSVIGARTQKYADYMDVAVALTGRAPLAGAHLDANRAATVGIDVAGAVAVGTSGGGGAPDDFYALLGYAVGLRAGAAVPVVYGLEGAAQIGADDLKAFSAAFGTTAAAPLFHIAGQTACEGLGQDRVPAATLDLAALRRSYDDLAPEEARGAPVDLVALGSPHFSVTELAALAALVAGSARHPSTRVVVTTSRAVLDAGAADAALLRAFGVDFVADTCWCMLADGVVDAPADPAATIVTNSAKYAHYAPGLVGRRPTLASLGACAAAATTGRAPARPPAWLATGARLAARRALSTLRRVR